MNDDAIFMYLTERMNYYPILKYDPQRLLADHRSSFAKMIGADHLGVTEWAKQAAADFHHGGLLNPAKMYPHQRDAAAFYESNPEMFIPLWGPRPERRYFFPLADVEPIDPPCDLMRRRKPSFQFKMYTMGAKSFQQAMEKANIAAQDMDRRMRLLMVQKGRVWDEIMFGEIDLTRPEPDFTRERFISNLLGSRDPRRVKRGRRMYKEWTARRRAKATLKWSKLEFDDHLLDTMQEPDLRRWYNTQLGEPYDPARYRKD